MFVDDVTLLDVAPKILSSNCATVNIELQPENDFKVTVKSRINPNLRTGYIRSDRYTWFG